MGLILRGLAMMSAKQLSTYERALARAQKQGIVITGRGTRKSDGATVYTTSSASEPGVWHLVTIEGAHLACDCTAGKRGLVCMHRALVHAQLVAELAAKAAVQVRIELRPASKPQTAPQSMLNRTRAFSMMA